MRYKGWGIAAACALALSGLLSTGCGDHEGPTEIKIHIKDGSDSTGTNGTGNGAVMIASAVATNPVLYTGACGPQSTPIVVVTNPVGGAVTYTSMNVGVATVNGNVVTEVAVGTDSIRVTTANDTKYVVIQVLACSQSNTITKVTISPHHPTLTITSSGEACMVATYDFNATVDGTDGVSNTPQNVDWTIAFGSVASTGINTATVTEASAGDYLLRATAHGTNVSDTTTVHVVGSCSTSSGNYAVPEALNFTLCANGFSGTSAPQQIRLYVHNVLVDSTKVLYMQPTATSTAPTLLDITPYGKASPDHLGSSYVMLSPTAAPTDTVRVPVSVTNTACVPVNTDTFSIPGGPFSLQSGTACTITSVQLPYYMNGVQYTGTVTWTSSTPSVATVNSTGLVTSVAGQSGSTTITGTGGGGSATTTVNVNSTSCQSQPISVSVSPASFALTVGQQPITLGCTVNNVPAGQSSSCTWVSYLQGTNNTGADCVALTTVDGTHVSVSAIAGCMEQIEVRAIAVADNSKFGSSIGTTSSGNVACTITSNGTTTGTITITQPNSTTATVSCVNEYGAGFRPVGNSNHPEIFLVSGSSGVTNVDGTNWTVGPIFTLRPVAPGSGIFTVQAALRDKTVIASRPVVVQ